MEKEYLPIKILHDFASRMEKLNIPYMLTGSMAMMRYSVYRMTADIDVIIEVKPERSNDIIIALEPDYYVPHNALYRAVSTRRMFNVIHQETAFKVDCVIKKTDEFQKTAFEQRERTDFYGREISIISQDDLIISKLWWAKDSNSEKQINDVKNLMRNDFDVDYIRNWVIKLGAGHLFEKCCQEIGK